MGFLATMCLRTTGSSPARYSPHVGRDHPAFAAALFGLGSAVRVGHCCSTGRRGLALGAVSTVLVGTVALGALAVTGGW